MNASELANLLGIRKITIRRWAKEKKIPSIVLPSGRMRFEPSAVIDALKKPESKDTESIKDEFLNLEELSAKLELPEEYLELLAKHGAIPFHIDSEKKLMFRLISVVDCLVKLNPQDMDISKTFSLYKILMGFHNEVKKE
ncbi:MAG: helix-turn-helix domain-containing protein [Sedimentisphaerales bacterium]